MTDTPYTAGFYDSKAIRVSAPSAGRIVPIVRSLFPIRSVLDVGCGRGDFLRAFQAAGVAEILGLDGDYVPRDRLLIDRSAFRPTDLAAGFDLGRRFDLVISLEVAEHLPETAAASFVQSLVRHGSVILFSAAIPHQRGIGHVNEQWQSYWAQAFAVHGLKPYDVIRPQIWNDEEVAWWYCQNVLLYATDAAAASSTRLSKIPAAPVSMLDLVHPRLYFRQLGRFQGLAAEMENLQTILRQATAFDVEHSPDGRMVIKPKQG
jgi:SAM-dependent methyltransferase